MSCWVTLNDDNGNPLDVELFSEGGTQPVGGSTKAELNITYNYSRVYDLLRFNLKDLHLKIASSVIDDLRYLVKKLGTTRHEDYWAATPGNAGFAISILLKWAEANPNGVFHVRG